MSLHFSRRDMMKGAGASLALLGAPGVLAQASG